MNYYITDMNINRVRNLEEINISLSEEQLKHLIFTGKNGSGKTTVLNSINAFLESIQNGEFQYLDQWKDSLEQQLEQRNQIEQQLQEPLLHEDPFQGSHLTSLQNNLQNINRNIKFLSGKLNQYFSIHPKLKSNIGIEEAFQQGAFIIAFYDAKRNTQMNIPSGINKFTINDAYRASDRPGSMFVQYLVNLRAQKSFARDEGDFSTSTEIDKWFVKFEKVLQDIFEDDTLKLEFDFKNFTFNFVTEGKEKFDFNTLSHGYSSILSIVTDLIMRMENKSKNKNYDLEGIVLIDEIETHLHVSLQKKILPFLTSFFPKLQFIITTHSPFVLSSTENAVIYDLENKLKVEDLSTYSYSGIIESFFENDNYSISIKERLYRYRELVNKDRLEDSEEEEMLELRRILKDVPSSLAPELYMEFSNIEMQRKGRIKR